MEWAQPENREVSGTDLIKEMVAVPRISPCQGHSVFILQCSLNDGYHNAGTNGWIVYGIVCIC